MLLASYLFQLRLRRVAWSSRDLVVAFKGSVARLCSFERPAAEEGDLAKGYAASRFGRAPSLPLAPIW